MSEDCSKPIGGYFELELPRRSLPYPEAMRFQSARAAFLALLQVGRPNRVWMPRFICDAMLIPLDMMGIECVYYNVTEQFAVDAHVTLGASDWLLYINYFGVCDAQVVDLLARFPSKKVVLDFSQAFFSPPVAEALATIYSPRKFFGVPDGGLLASRLLFPLPDRQDAGSFARTSHLLRRLGDSPEAGYEDYRRAEGSLAVCTPARMSALTERLLSSVDYDAVSKRRMDNFTFLQERLSHANRLVLPASLSVAPLCYPFMGENADLRQLLIRKRIFLPTYWPDALGRVGKDWGENMIRKLLPLPIDQRYEQKDMERLALAILGESA